jgi:hypothetical protein
MGFYCMIPNPLEEKIKKYVFSLSVIKKLLPLQSANEGTPSGKKEKSDAEERFLTDCEVGKIHR